MQLRPASPSPQITPSTVRIRRRSGGFALIATISVMVLLVMIALAMLSLSTIELRSSNKNVAMAEAQANARMALMIAIGELQKYAGPDQRVTARADITDPNWKELQSSLPNPGYTLVWDVSGSEMDFSPNRVNGGGALNQPLQIATANHRPGMNPGHDFKKVPAVLVSGNEKYNLSQPNVDDPSAKVYGITATQYPAGYITPNTDLTSGQIPSISIVPQEFIQERENAPTDEKPQEIRVPLVESTNQSMYAWWVSDESIKARVNLGLEHEKDSKSARMLAQRAPINPYQPSIDSTQQTPQEARKLLTVPSLTVAFPNSASTNQNSFSYSPDVSMVSESILSDTRNAGLKQDFTYALYNQDAFNPDGTVRLDPDTGLPLMPESLKDNQFIIDPIGGFWTNGAAAPYGINGGETPNIRHLRDFAQVQDILDTSPTISVNTKDLMPVVSQVQAAIHASYKSSGSNYEVYYSVFPSVTLWNPYNVPIKVDKEIKISLFRRAGTSAWGLNLFKADYQVEGGPIIRAFNNGQNWTDENGKRHWNYSGWNFKILIKNPADSGDPEIVIPPGKAMVFSPKEITQRDQPVARYTNDHSTRTTLNIEVQPGWRPGKGLLFKVDTRTHTATGAQLPRLRISLGGGISSDNIRWEAMCGDRRMAIWAVMRANYSNWSSFFTPPATTDGHQDTRGGFPALLYKHALRMGDDYLDTPTAFKHPDQKDLKFPFVANYNPRALFHTGIAASLASNPNSNHTKFYTSEGTQISPSLMGALYDYQKARSIYTVPTYSDDDLFSYIGNGYLGGEDMILAELPTRLNAPNSSSGSIISFTQLNSSNLLRGNSGRISRTDWGWYATCHFPAFPIGNSLADYRLDVTHENLNLSGLKFYGSIAKKDSQGWRVNSTHYDMSYLLNDYFYDHYFFSSIPQTGTYNESEPLVHERMTPTTTDIAKLRSINSANHLHLKGGFNINSTSVAAWEMILSSSLGLNFKDVNDTTKNVTFQPRLESKNATLARDMQEDSAVSGSVNMQLDPDQVKALAKAIVKEVKRRGPFPNLSSFVNRTNYLKDTLRNTQANENVSDTYVDVRYSGALQSALDFINANAKLDSLKTINSDDFAKNGKASQGQNPRIYPGIDALRKSANSHLPGYLKQSDILRQIDPVITPRGDTFTIRTVGISKAKNGRILAKVACEAVVQRNLDYLDASQPSDMTPYEITSDENGTKTLDWKLNDINRRYGRAFKIVSFKWLPQTEVAKMKINNL